MDHLIKKQKLPQLTQYKTGYLKSPMTFQEIEYVIFKKSPRKEISRSTWFYCKALLQVQRINTNSTQLLPELKEEGMLPSLFTEASIALIPKSSNDSYWKKKIRPKTFIIKTQKYLTKY